MGSQVLWLLLDEADDDDDDDDVSCPSLLWKGEVCDVDDDVREKTRSTS